MFRTSKYRPEFPGIGFESVETVRDWAVYLAPWYNTEYPKSGARYVICKIAVQAVTGSSLSCVFCLTVDLAQRNLRGVLPFLQLKLKEHQHG